MVRDLIDIEEAGAGDMGLRKQSGRILALIGEIIGRVQ